LSEREGSTKPLSLPLQGWRRFRGYVYGRMAAKELGIRSRNETPQAWLTTLALPGSVVGVLAAHLGRYGQFVAIAYLAFCHVEEWLAWM
jgi:hypothetical protein